MIITDVIVAYQNTTDQALLKYAILGLGLSVTFMLMTAPFLVHDRLHHRRARRRRAYAASLPFPTAEDSLAPFLAQRVEQFVAKAVKVTKYGDGRRKSKIVLAAPPISAPAIETVFPRE